MPVDQNCSAATEQDYLEDNIGTVAFHLGQPGASLSVSYGDGAKLLVDPGEVLKEVSRRLSAPAQSVGMRAALERAQKIIERDYPNGQLAIDIRAVLASQPSPAATVETQNVTASADGGPGSVRTDQNADLNAPATSLSRCSAATGDDEFRVCQLHWPEPYGSTIGRAADEIDRLRAVPQPTQVPIGLKTNPALLALIERAKTYVMSPEEVYEQRRSFTRGMCPSNRDYTEWCEAVDRLLPPLSLSRPQCETQQQKITLREALENLLSRIDNHFGGYRHERDWKEQTDARIALSQSRSAE